MSQAWRSSPVIPALGKKDQKDQEFMASLGSIAVPCLKKK
jgi:hypothetical protein